MTLGPPPCALKPCTSAKKTKQIPDIPLLSKEFEDIIWPVDKWVRVCGGSRHKIAPSSVGMDIFLRVVWDTSNPLLILWISFQKFITCKSTPVLFSNIYFKEKK